MMMRSTRPIQSVLPSEILGLPTAATHGIRTVRPRTVGSLSQLLSSASDFLHRHLFCSHRTPGASELICPSHTRKHALTNVCLFTSMSPLLGVRGMLEASQFADVVLFQFSGPNVYSSVQPLLRSFSRDSTTASFFSSCSCRTQIDFNGARGRTCVSPQSEAAVEQQSIQ